MKRFILSSILAVMLCGWLQGQTQTPGIPDMLENALTSVVTVAVEETEETKQMLGFRGEIEETAYEKILDLSESKGSGSGFVIDRNGKKYVITNAHVIEDAAETAGAVFAYSINRTKYEMKVLGGDSFYDIAVLEFVTPPGKEISPITFATKESRIGEQVFAIGNPLGEYPYTISEGIISAKNRVRGGLTGKFGFLQTTATVIWGNSGGPLINKSGQVVGINSQIAFAKLGGQSIWQPQINFALEGTLSNRLVNDILTNAGMIKRAFIGLEIAQTYNYNPFSTRAKDGWELGDTIPVITGIIPGSPAEMNMMNKTGWKILKVKGNDVRNTEEILGEFESVKPGEKVILTLKAPDGSIQNDTIITRELTTEDNQTLAQHAVIRHTDFDVFNLDGKAILSFREKPPVDTAAGEKPMTNTRAEKMRGSEITSGSWEIIAAGYDEQSLKSMWRVKTVADLGAALRLNASLGLLDLYLLPKESRFEKASVKRISFSGSDENKWVKFLYY